VRIFFRFILCYTFVTELYGVKRLPFARSLRLLLRTARIPTIQRLCINHGCHPAVTLMDDTVNYRVH